MTKEDYNKTSDKLKLPRRCPIFDNCERRVLTVFLNSYCHKNETISSVSRDMKSNGDMSTDYEKYKIAAVGEFPEAAKGYGDWYKFSNFCPEISLFEKAHRPGIVPALALSDGSYVKDKKWISEYEESKHFSECKEFSKYHYSIKISAKKQRKTIPLKLRFEVFQRDKFTCKYCNRTKEDGIKLELDHKVAVADGGPDSFENLITSCYECNRGKGKKSL